MRIFWCAQEIISLSRKDLIEMVDVSRKKGGEIETFLTFNTMAYMCLCVFVYVSTLYVAYAGLDVVYTSFLSSRR